MSDTSMDLFDEDRTVLHRVKFGILLTLQIPSIVISLFIFLFFTTHRPLLSVRQNQALLLLLIVNFIQVAFDLPMAIHFNRLGYVSPASPSYCKWWTFLEFTLNVVGEMLMATISIQRHILVFHAHIFNNSWYRYLFHHFPLLFCIAYPLVFYVIIILFDTCDGTQWDFSANACGFATCYLVYNKALATFDWAANNGLPMVIIIIANVLLVVRVIRQKLRRQGLVTWRKQRRMTLQLLSISCLYWIGWFPNLMIGVVQQLFVPTFLADIQSAYLFDLIYLICLLLPWVCLGLFPEFNKWIQKHLFHKNIRKTTVMPTNNLN